MPTPAIPIPPGRDILVDAVDAHDHIIGQIPRHAVFAAQINFRVVHVFVFSRHGELLLQQLAKGHRHPGLWGSSVASYVGAGSTYAQTAQGRMRAELGVGGTLRRFGKTHMTDLGSKKFIELYVTRNDGPFVPDATEVATAQFFPLSSIAPEARQWPERFTPTFLHLFDFYMRGRQQRPSTP